MGKKANTILFVLIGTVVNLGIIIIIWGILMMVFQYLYRNMDEVSSGLSMLAILVSLLGSIVGGFFIYSRIVKWADKKWGLERYIEPFFLRRKR